MDDHILDRNSYIRAPLTVRKYSKSNLTFLMNKQTLHFFFFFKKKYSLTVSCASVLVCKNCQYNVDLSRIKVAM